MTMTFSICTSLAFILSNTVIALTITPDTENNYPSISIQLTDDPRNLTKINDNNEWELNQFYANPLKDWGITVTLSDDEYGFEPNMDESSFSISISGYCDGNSNQCDAYFAFGIGNEEYLTFMTDLDGGLGRGAGGVFGIFVYPPCDSSSIADGDASQLISSMQETLTVKSVKDALSGGDANNFGTLSDTANAHNLPLNFTFTNNDITNEFIFTFSSPTFPNGLECKYNSAVGTDKDFNLYMTPAGSASSNDIEIIKIDGITVSGETSTTTATPTTLEPTTPAPTTPNPTTAQPTTTTQPVECTCSSDWELILDHKDVDNGYFSSDFLNTGLENKDDPTANTYSIIGLFNNNQTLKNKYKDENGKYKFKLIYKYYDSSLDDSIFIWTQKSWPGDSTDIEEANLTLIPDQSSKGDVGTRFFGLGLSGASNVYLDGTATEIHTYHYHSVGMTSSNYGIPADYKVWAGSANFAYSSSLYILKTGCECQSTAFTTTSSFGTSDGTSTTPYVEPSILPTALPTKEPTSTTTQAFGTSDGTSTTPYVEPSILPTALPTSEPTDCSILDIDSYLEHCSVVFNANEDEDDKMEQDIESLDERVTIIEQEIDECGCSSSSAAGSIGITRIVHNESSSVDTSIFSTGMKDIIIIVLMLINIFIIIYGCLPSQGNKPKIDFVKYDKVGVKYQEESDESEMI